MWTADERGERMDMYGLFIGGTIAFIVWILLNAYKRTETLKYVSEFNSRLFDRLGSGKDFSDFLQTEGGGKLLNSLTLEPRVDTSSLSHNAADPRMMILRTIQTGVVLLSLGAGLVLVSRVWQNEESLAIMGVIGLSIGGGLLASALASYRVGKTLGLLENKRS
jgi:hypothetical protein